MVQAQYGHDGDLEVQGNVSRDAGARPPDRSPLARHALREARRRHRAAFPDPSGARVARLVAWLSARSWVTSRRPSGLVTLGCPEVKLLLDTHIWVWSHVRARSAHQAGGGGARGAGNELWLSPISVWEFLVLVERVARVVLKTHARRVGRSGAGRGRPCARRRSIAKWRCAAGRCKVPHQDPADRFLAATADVYGLTLVTADEHLLKGRGFAKLANR